MIPSALCFQGSYIGLAPNVEGDLVTTPIIANLEVDVTEVFEDCHTRTCRFQNCSFSGKSFRSARVCS